MPSAVPESGGPAGQPPGGSRDWAGKPGRDSGVEDIGHKLLALGLQLFTPHLFRLLASLPLLSCYFRCTVRRRLRRRQFTLLPLLACTLALPIATRLLRIQRPTGPPVSRWRSWPCRWQQMTRAS